MSIIKAFATSPALWVLAAILLCALLAYAWLAVGQLTMPPPSRVQAIDVAEPKDPEHATHWRVPVSPAPVKVHRLRPIETLWLALTLLPFGPRPRPVPPGAMLDGEVVDPEPGESTEDLPVPADPEEPPAAPEVAEAPDPLNGPVTGPYAALALWDGTDKMPKLTPELLALLDDLKPKPGDAYGFALLDEKQPLRPVADVPVVRDPSGSFPILNRVGGAA